MYFKQYIEALTNTEFYNKVTTLTTGLLLTSACTS